MPRKETGKTQAQNYGRSMDGSNSFGVVVVTTKDPYFPREVKLHSDAGQWESTNYKG